MRRGQPEGGIPRRRTPLVSVSLDSVTWDALQIIAARQSRTVDDLVVEIVRDSLGLAIHIYIAEFYRTAVPEPDRPDEETC
jgi:predicted DNA-binding ribbon-helix-helix protein